MLIIGASVASGCYAAVISYAIYVTKSDDLFEEKMKSSPNSARFLSFLIHRLVQTASLEQTEAFNSLCLPNFANSTGQMWLFQSHERSEYPYIGIGDFFSGKSLKFPSR